MATKSDFHVYPQHARGPMRRWEIKQAGELIARCHKRKMALRIARALAREDKASLRIHGEDGRFLEERSYGNESKRPG